MYKVLIIKNEQDIIMLRDREIIDTELKINMLNWDRKYNDIAKICYDLYYNKFIMEKLIEVNNKEFEYVKELQNKTYQEWFNVKYSITE